MPQALLSLELRLLTALILGTDQQVRDALLAGADNGGKLSWDRFKRLAHGNGVAGLAAARLVGFQATHPDLAQTASGMTAAWPGFKAECAALHLAQSAWASRLTQMIEAAGAPVLVIKGVALAHSNYPQAPYLRNASDIDLLISPDDLFRVDAALLAGGLVRRWPTALPEPRGRDMFLLLANVFEYVDPVSGQLIELHYRLTVNPSWIRTDFASLFRNSVELKLPQGPIRTITGPDHLSYLCFHAFSHTAFRLKWFCDIAAVLRQVGATSVSDAIAPRAASVPVKLADRVLGCLMDGIQAGSPPGIGNSPSPKVRQVIADMEDPVDIMDGRTLASLPAELRFRLFLMRIAPSWTGKLFEILRGLADPRDIAVIGLDRRFATVYALCGPVLALRRLLTRSSPGKAV